MPQTNNSEGMSSTSTQQIILM